MPKKRIVVANDSAIFRKALCDFLQHSLNLTVVATAADGVEALRLVQEMKPDILILDITMPLMNGWDVLHQIQNSSPPVDTLILSIYSSPELEERALASGAYAWILKDDPQILVDTLHQLIDT